MRAFRWTILAAALLSAAACGDSGSSGQDAASEGGDGSTDTADSTAGGEDTSSDVDADSTEGSEDTDAGGEDTAELPAVENCNNGTDDDGDTDVDCDDDDCDDDEICKPVLETCDNGADDNGNALVDCDDPGCAFDAVCNTPCGAFYGCLVLEGCPCTPGVDCPTSGTTEYGNCLNSCLQNPLCAQICEDSLLADDKAIVSAMFDCADDSCGGQLSNACVFGPCLEQWAVCEHEGAGTCADFNACADACPPSTGPSECTAECQSNTAPSGIIDAVTHGNCVIAACNVDNNDKFDSPQCQTFAYYISCQEQASSCVDPAWGTTDGATCSELLLCLAACEEFGTAAGCEQECIQATDIGQLAAAAEWIECVFDECTTFPDGLTPECIGSSLTGACATQATACAGAPFVEDCASAKDDDADGKVNCDDEDCAVSRVCAPPVEICNNSDDDDSDGAADCLDEDCATDPACTPPPSEICDNLEDDDGDEAADCADDDCSASPACL